MNKPTRPRIPSRLRSDHHGDARISKKGPPLTKTDRFDMQSIVNEVVRSMTKRGDFQGIPRVRLTDPQGSLAIFQLKDDDRRQLKGAKG